MKFETERGLLESLLIQAGISKAELARRLGVTPNAVNKWRVSAPLYSIAYLKLLIKHNRLLPLPKD